MSNYSTIKSTRYSKRSMENNNWKIDDDRIYLNSVDKINIPWLQKSLDIWIDLEENESCITKGQKAALDEFKSLPNSLNFVFSSELEKLHCNEIKKNSIHKLEFDDILKTINWEKTQVCIPQLYQSENKYIFLLPETNWKIIDSDFTLELELLFTNGEIELCREMSGLWCRIEWFEEYIKRKSGNI